MKFPGVLPAAFSRKDFPAVQSGDYLFSEKTDGIRFMLLLNNDGVYLIDRHFQLFYVHGMVCCYCYY